MAKKDVEAGATFVTDVAQTGWLSRLGRSFAGVLFVSSRSRARARCCSGTRARHHDGAFPDRSSGVVRASMPAVIDPPMTASWSCRRPIAVSGLLLDAEFGMRSNGRA